MSPRPTPGPGGLVVVDKPAGMTSHDVVARVRRLAGTRKVGHAGTLDPMATGVLVVGVERATRLLGHLLLTDKAYEATVCLGASTSTDDAEGELTGGADASGLAEDQIREALAAQVGEIDQVPSSVSAIKVNGKRAYQRVSEGEAVALEPRRVRIEVIEIRGIDRAAERVEVRIGVRCSSGTYIRAIARDAGSALEVGGHLTALRRTAVGPFDLGRARTLEKLAEDFAVLPIAAAARASFPALDLDQTQAALVRVGRKLPLELPGSGPVALFDPAGDFLALYEQGGDLARAVAVFV